MDISPKENPLIHVVILLLPCIVFSNSDENSHAAMLYNDESHTFQGVSSMKCHCRVLFNHSADN